MFCKVNVGLSTARQVVAAETWESFLADHFPERLKHPLSKRHIRLWEWFARLSPGVDLPVRIEGWPRGGGKSTSVQDGIAWLATKGQIKFVLYVCGTQADAQMHLASIATRLEKLGLKKAEGMYGRSKGYNKSVIRCSNGFSIKAVGLDQAIRGVKLDDDRPQLIVFDDIDGLHDSEYITRQKEGTITKSIIPAASSEWCNFIFAQNPMIPNGVFSRLVDGRADYFGDRDIPTIEKAIQGLEYTSLRTPSGRVTHKITKGVPTWEGQGIETCEKKMNGREGIQSFLTESQHEIYDGSQFALWKKAWLEYVGFRLDQAYFGVETFAGGRKIPLFKPPEPMVKIVVGVDGNVADRSTATGIPDECGIVAVGQGISGKRYVLADLSGPHDPTEWPVIATNLANVLHCPIVFEKNQGGKLNWMVLNAVASNLEIEGTWASESKEARAVPVATLYSQGMYHHCGEFPDLEREQILWNPHAREKSPNRIDALVIADSGLGMTFTSGPPRVKSQITPRGQSTLDPPKKFNYRTGEDE